jgi:hypothetical protein
VPVLYRGGDIAPRNFDHDNRSASVTEDAYSAISNDRESLAHFREGREADARQRLKQAVPETVAAYCSAETTVPARYSRSVGHHPAHDTIANGRTAATAKDATDAIPAIDRSLSY